MSSEQFDARAWLVWVLAGMAAATAARNPLYSIIIFTSAWAVRSACALPGQIGVLPLARLAPMVIGLGAVFNALFSHFGDTVLFELPSSWPLIGGPITFEALIYGASNGLALLALLAVFSVLNTCVPTHTLVRLTPRAFHSLGVVLMIAVSYGPQTVRHLGQVREAQAVRGHRLRGVRDVRPLMLPLLIGGLERAMGLAETMVARGYGATSDVDQPTLMRAGLALSLLALLAGWLLAVFGNSIGLALMLVGAGLLLVLLRRLRHRVQTTVYRPRRWTIADSGLCAASAAAALVILQPLPWTNSDSLFYYPYPQASLPPFDVTIGLALALLALPAALHQSR